MPAAMFGIPDDVGRRLGVLRTVRAAALRRVRRGSVPDRTGVVRVRVEHRTCPCGGWVAVVAPEGLPVRHLHATDPEEAAYVVQYELDVIMSETGRVVAPTIRAMPDRPR